MDDVLNGVISFQSPRSGKFESNVLSSEHSTLSLTMFQSPRSGKFESNELTSSQIIKIFDGVSIP